MRREICAFSRVINNNFWPLRGIDRVTANFLYWTMEEMI